MQVDYGGLDVTLLPYCWKNMKVNLKYRTLSSRGRKKAAWHHVSGTPFWGCECSKAGCDAITYKYAARERLLRLLNYMYVVRFARRQSSHLNLNTLHVSLMFLGYGQSKFYGQGEAL